MNRINIRHIVSIIFVFIITSFILLVFAGPSPYSIEDYIKKYTSEKLIPDDSLKFPIRNRSLDLFGFRKSNSLDLSTPSIFDRNLILDTSLNNYHFYNSIDGLKIGDEEEISLSDYLSEQNKLELKYYFKERAKAQNFLQGSKGFSPRITIKAPKVVEDILGGGIDIKPQGSAELIFSLDVNKIENPAWSLKQQRTTQFKFDQKIKLNVRGNIGDKIGLGIGYDTESSFDFDNEIKLRFEGEEDDIVKILEAGNVSLPVQGSLITGSQSLFGVKAKLQFGKLTMTNVFSQQKSEKKEIIVENGAQKNMFSISALEYDANKHFFLNLHFRNNIYEQALATIPVINSPIQITRVEVWVMNSTADYRNTRNVIALMDLGEPDPWNSNTKNPEPGNFAVSKSSYPDNNANTLYANINKTEFRSFATVSAELTKLGISPTSFYNGQDYLKIDNARMLSPTEYVVNEKLGYISLNQRLDPGYALAVAYEYTYNGVRYQVGEFSQDIPPDPNNANVLFVKMLKSTAARTDIPMWDLMMKNIYAIGTSQIQPTEFKLDVIYEDPVSGGKLNYLPEDDEPKIDGKLLLQLLGLDKLNSQQNEQADGIFDFIDGITILQNQGKIIFPYLEPFGKTLENLFEDKNKSRYYAFHALYDSNQVQAEQQKQFDRFYLRGHYMGSSGSEISLMAINIPEGSVQVFSGGIQLRENVDYTVDYTLGRVKIINQSYLSSGQPIKITAESNTLFAIQQKVLMGTRLDYKFSEDFLLGGTLLYLKEKPLTQKVNIGSEPLNNVIYGFDGTYRTDSRFITKMIDKLPFIETKEKSEVLVTGEFAQMIPGHPKVIGPTGTSYIDDFEGSEVPYDLRTGNYWVLASTPQWQSSLFPYGNLTNDYRYNFKRAKISWYAIDDLFYRANSYTPPNINNDMLSRHRMREVLETEVFPNKQLPKGIPSTLRTFDIAYFPTQRGPYNYDAASIDDFGRLKDPKGNWAGIMRKIETNDFEAANIEYIEFWLMDPYADEDFVPDDGKLYFHLGDISEDILKDGVKFFENGLPKDGDLTKVNTTIWGNVPSSTPINYTFDNDPQARQFQDLGFDGLNDQQELEKFDSFFIKKLSASMNPEALQKILNDPSADNYHFFRGDDLDSAQANIIERYLHYKNSQNNSPVPEGNEAFSSSGSLSPDVEDINGDFTLNEIEAYYQYVINLHKDMNIGENFIVDKQTRNVKLRNGEYQDVIWYQFKIPIRAYEKRIGQIRDFKSIRFLRLVATDFEKDVILRFARLQLVRGEWRRYLYNLKEAGEVIGPGDEGSSSTFDISTVNIEANGKRDPIPYVLPPGIEREVDISTYELLERNEQSLSLTACLEDGDAKAAYKNTSFDVRTYKRMKMFVHAESLVGESLEPGDLSLFIRLGTDFTNNYYEYEIPLYPTAHGSRDKEAIWDERNEINLLFAELFRVKQSREMTAGYSLVKPFTQPETDGEGKITVMGNPDLSNVKVIMIGIRNPSKDNPFNPNDDGTNKCGIVWVNELRVTDFDEKGGYAAIGKVTAKLADFGRLNLSGNIKTVGFGGLEQKLQDRSKEDVRAFDIQTYFELGKFFPQKYGVKIPFFYNYSQSSSRPQYNPLSPDILLQARLDLAKTRQEEDSILNAVETFVSRTSFNLMNVQKLRTTPGSSEKNKKPRFYDIENFILSYAYNDVFKHDITTEYDLQQNHQFIINYNYTFKDLTLTPFSKLSKSKYLKLITDFNFSPLPQAFSFQGKIDRRYGEILYRNNSDIQTIIKPIYDKDFRINRVYEYRHNLSRSIRFNYNAIVDAYVEEPLGPKSPETRDSLISNLRNFGNTKSFDQKVGLTYDLPTRKIPLLDWTTVRASYTGSYNWQEAPPASKELGNVVQNAQTIQLNGQLNFISLYGKVKFLRNINSNKSNVSDIRKKKFKEMQEEAKEKNVPLLNDDGEKMTEKDVPVNEGFINVVESMLRVLMSVRNVTVNYTLNEGTTMPGYDERPSILGNDWKINAPGIPFLLGLQDDNFRFMAAENGWLTKDTTLNTLYMTQMVDNLTIQGNIEPFKEFRINVDMSRRMTNNYQEVFRYDELSGEFVSRSPIEGGNFSMTFWSLPTALKGKWNDKVSPVYTQFENNRLVIAKRLGTGTDVDTFGFPAGFTRTAQEVIIPALLAAYSGKDALNYNLSMFPKIPAPNWRITYSGLGKIEFLKKYIKNINLNHAYRSTYTIGNFISSLEYDENEIPVVGKNLVPEYRIQQITISEQLAPLIGLDINWANNWTSRLQYSTNRNVSFSFSNLQTAEIRDRDFTLGIGYRAKEVEIPFLRIRNKRIVLDNDLNFRFDMSIKSNRSVIARLDQGAEDAENVGGNKLISIKPTLDYVIDNNLTIRLFFNKNITKPVISTSYPTEFTSVGFSIRYTLGQ